MSSAKVRYYKSICKSRNCLFDNFNNFQNLNITQLLYKQYMIERR